MLIDSNLVLADNEAITSNIAGSAVALTSFKKPGREEPIPFYMVCTVAGAGGTSVAFKLQQADTQGGTYSDVPGASWTVLLAALTKGARLGPRFLPEGVTKPWIKLVSTNTGTFTAGKVFAAIVREDDLPMESGMYIDHGVTVG